MARARRGIVVTRTRRTSRLGSYLRSRGMREGVLRGNRIWFALGAAAWVVHRLAGSEQRATVELRPGERLLVTHRLPGGQETTSEVS